MRRKENKRPAEMARMTKFSQEKKVQGKMITARHVLTRIIHVSEHFCQEFEVGDTACTESD